MDKGKLSLRALRVLAVFVAMLGVSLAGEWLIDQDFAWAVPVSALAAGLAFILVWKTFDVIERHRDA